MIIDAKDMILGRLAAFAAKKALLGHKVDIVNCEKAVITGKRSMVLQKYKQTYSRGIPLKGPYFPRMPDRLVRRTIRGMLPYKQERGRDAFKRIMCHKGIPPGIDTSKSVKLESADIAKVPSLNFTTVSEVCRHLGAKI